METLIVLVIIVLVVIWVSKNYSGQKTKMSEPKITVSISSSPSSSFDNPDTGPVTATHDGGWILNPKGTLPLTIYGIDQQTVEELKGLLDKGYTQGTYAHARTIVPIIARSNLRCKEIDDYVKKFKPQYLGKIEDLKKSSAEWTSASINDREDLLIEFRQQAIESLEIQPYCDIETLFECEPADATIDDVLIDRFGYENLQLYFRYGGNLKKVHVIPANHYDRSGFEKLVELGLVIRGADIPLGAILETLKLKDMNDLVADLQQKHFGRKAKAIEFLINLPDIQQRISKIVAFRELFQLKPLPDDFSGIDLSNVSEAWRHANEIATIITHTYVMSGYAARNMAQEKDDLSYIRGWELSPVNDGATCPCCKRAASKTYSKKQYPKVPLHIGCRCGLVAKLED